MLNRTGLILKLKDNIAFVISKDCMYYQIKRKPGMLKGQTVEFNQSDIIYNRSFFARHYNLIAGVAAVLIIMVSIIVYINSSFNTQNKIYAFIDIDINPSLEITIDKDRHIQDIYPLNKDAEILLSELNLKEIPMETGLSKIIDKSKQLGFLNAEDKDIVLISAALNGNKEDSGTLIMDICSSVNQLKDKNIETQVIDVPLEKRELALENNISMGRYVLYEKARESGLNVSIDAVKAISLENILEKVSLKGIQVNNSIVPTPIPQPRPSDGDSGKPYTANTYNPPQEKTNNPAPVSMPTPAPVQRHSPTAILQRFPALTPTPVKAVQSDSNKNTPDDLDPVSTLIPTLTPTPTPSLTPTATATLLPAETSSPQGYISVSFDTTEIHTIGQVICATLKVNNIRKLSSFQANLKYDPQVLQPVDSAGTAYNSITEPENGTLLQNSKYAPISFSSNNISNGILNFSRSYANQRNYKKEGFEEHTGSLAVIRFKILQLKNTNIIFQNTNNSLKEKSGIVLFDWDGGTISNFEVIQPGPLVVNLENNPVTAPESSKSPNYATELPSLTRIPTPTDISLHTPTLTPTSTPTSTPTPTPVLKNYDINGDGYINMEDSLLIDIAFNTHIGEPNYNPDGDLNADGFINMIDKILFLAYLKNHMPSISTTPGTPYPTNMPVATPVSQNYITMSFDTTEITAVGQVILATLEVNNIRNLAGFQANLQYDPEVLQPVTASGNGYDEDTEPEKVSLFLDLHYIPISVSFNNNIPNGILNFGRAYSWLKNYKNSGSEEHTGALAIIRFKVLQLKDTNIIFRNTNNSLNEKSGIVLSDWDGEVISNFDVIQPNTLTVNSVSNPTITPVNSSITGTPTPTATRTATPTVTPTATPTPTPTPIKNYDINGDGYINMEDSLLIDIAFNTLIGDPAYNPDCDLNSDNVINMIDKILFLEYLSKQTAPVPTISDTPCPTSMIYTPVPTSESTWTPTPTPPSIPTGL
jgi:hypothetical protein